MDRMSLSYTDSIWKWLEKRSKETGATKAGVIRKLIEKEIKKDEISNTGNTDYDDDRLC